MIYLIRHGETELNHAKLLQGRSDYPLNENGVAQAEKAGAWFETRHIRFDRVCSSPLRRAVQTARIVTRNRIPVYTDDRLTEMDYGPYEGMDLSAPPPEVVLFFSDFVHQPAPEGMEPLPAVVERLGVFLEELKTAAGEGNILISTHAIALKGALEYLTPDARGRYWAKHIGNCAVYRTELADGVYRVPLEVFSG